MATYMILTTLSLVLTARLAAGAMDITAFEYVRKFSRPLNLGDCPRREVPVNNNGAHGTMKLKCSRRKTGNVTSLTRPVHSKRNAPISTPGDIIAYLGLCGGEAASFLGILNNGDCVAIEIASKLTFSEKTMIRGYVEYYRKGLDILENNQWQRKDIETKKDGNYYLKNISYGTLEIILVQFRFRSRKDTMKAKEIKGHEHSLMSVYMETIRKEVRMPTSLLVIRLSTVAKGKYETKSFKNGQYAYALRHVRIMEAEIKHLRDEIDEDKIAPHLRYSLYPFEVTHNQSGRLAPRLSSEMWEKTSVLEITLRQAVSVGKKARRRCRKVRTQLCVRVRELYRTLKKTQRKIHKSRSRWVDLSVLEKQEVASKSTSKINSYANVMKNLSRSVRKWWKIEKLERLKRKNNRKNQTGPKGMNRMIRKGRRF